MCVCAFFPATVSVHLQFTNEIIYLVSRMDEHECKQRSGRLFINADDSLDLQLFVECAKRNQSSFCYADDFSVKL